LIKVLVINVEKENQLDFGDFRQIILYFGLSIITHIEFRLTVITYRKQLDSDLLS